MTFYQVEERFRGYALVRCQPKTGRTHQIRIHMTHIGHPIVADKLYSGRDRLTLESLTNTEKPSIRLAEVSETTLIDRQALHAQVLKFVHPATGKELSLTGSLPADFAPRLTPCGHRNPRFVKKSQQAPPLEQTRWRAKLVHLASPRGNPGI